MAADDMKFRIEMLDVDNYSIWSIRMKLYLTNLGSKRSGEAKDLRSGSKDSQKASSEPITKNTQWLSLYWRLLIGS